MFTGVQRLQVPVRADQPRGKREGFLAKVTRVLLAIQLELVLGGASALRTVESAAGRLLGLVVPVVVLAILLLVLYLVLVFVVGRSPRQRLASCGFLTREPQ